MTLFGCLSLQIVADKQPSLCEILTVDISFQSQSVVVHLPIITTHHEIYCSAAFCCTCTDSAALFHVPTKPNSPHLQSFLLTSHK